MKHEGLSLIEVAIAILKETREQITVIDLYKKVAAEKEFNEEEYAANLPQFYTDVVSNGSFIYCGEDKWSLKENETFSALNASFYSEHAQIEGEEEYLEQKKKAKESRAKAKKEALTEVQDEDEEEMTAEEIFAEKYDQDIASFDSDEDEDDDETQDREADFDSQLDEDEDDEDDDEEYDADEEEYNDIMDSYEDMYDDKD